MAEHRFTSSDVDAMTREVHRRSFVDFLRDAFAVLEPHRTYVHGPHLDVTARHLDATTDGTINRLIINQPPGTMKPIAVDEPVVTKRGTIRLGDVVPGDEVLTHHGRFRRVSAVHEQGELDVVAVSTNDGRRVVAAPDHPFLTPDGWVSAGDLAPGSYVGYVRSPGFDGDTPMPDYEARFLGYLVGDGSIAGRGVSFTNQDRDVLDDFKECARKLGFYPIERDPRNPKMLARAVDVRPSAEKWNTHRYGEPPTLRFLQRHGLYRTNSNTKHVPDAVFHGGSEAARNFIGAYWACDGSVFVRHDNDKFSISASASTISPVLARNVQELASSIGIRLRVRDRSRVYEGEWYRYLVMHTKDRNEVVAFSDLPGLGDRKRDVAKLAFRDRFDLTVLPDEVTSVDDAGTATCRCLTVEQDASFTVAGLAVHNSLTSGVVFPAWVWGPLGMPHARFLAASHGQDYAERDNVKTRNLVGSDWYQNLYPGVRVDPKNDAKAKFSTTASGFRQATPIGSMTGARSDFVIIDDPHSTEGAESDADRERALRIMSESVPTRLEDPKRSVIIVVMQRLHERDVTGFLLDNELGWDNLCLPMEYEPDHPLQKPTRLGDYEWRTEPGELLFPARFPSDVVERDKEAMRAYGGDYAVAGQFQQRPEPRGGGMVPTDALRKHLIDVEPHPKRIKKLVRSWDKAGTKDAGAYTAGVLMAKLVDSTYVVLDVVKDRLAATERDAMMRDTADQDVAKWGKVQQVIEQEPGSGGKDSYAATARVLSGHDVKPDRVTGSKEERMNGFASQAGAGNVAVLNRGFTEPYLDELGKFPRGRFRDQADATSSAFNFLQVVGRAGAW